MDSAEKVSRWCAVKPSRRSAPSDGISTDEMIRRYWRSVVGDRPRAIEIRRNASRSCSSVVDVPTVPCASNASKIRVASRSAARRPWPRTSTTFAVTCRSLGRMRRRPGAARCPTPLVAPRASRYHAGASSWQQRSAQLPHDCPKGAWRDARVAESDGLENRCTFWVPWVRIPLPPLASCA